MWSTDQGYAGLEKFTTTMNLPSPMTKKNYNASVNVITKAVTEVAKKTMHDAAKEIVSSTASADIGVSTDGTWQQRGYSSYNGVVATLSMLTTGNVLDVESMSRICKQCKLHEPLKTIDPEKFKEWYESHHCKLNSTGSAGNMEVASAQRIFSRSVEQYGLRYTQFYGDGDSKSYSAVKSIYPDIEVEKLECVGHVQKRIGTRLRNLKKNVKNLGGRGKLTNSTIDKLQNYYGIAIRSNANDLEGMKKAVHATLFHVASSTKNNWHTHCPTGKDSWCRFNRDKATGKSTYRPGPGLPMEVIKHLKPIYEELSADVLIRKCLHGQTQNQNESLNCMIWERIPKTKYVGFTQLEFGVYDAVANFNIGRKSTVDIYRRLGMVPGRYTKSLCNLQNRKRLYFAEYKGQEPAKKRRKVLRGMSKRSADTSEAAEGTVCTPGAY